MTLAEVAVIGVFSLLGQQDMTGMLQLSAAAAGGAVVATVVTLGSFAILGNLFGILTGSQLLELANPSQPLLRRLLVETPGTYHHSLMVGNLAERAAESIGADPLLARVAAYYHDVGKLANPLVFIENQQGGDNVHDQLEPEDSAAILRQHVADGMNLALKARLPKPLIAFIPQHHGTSLIAFFYAKAREAAAAPFGGLETKAGRAAAEAVDRSPSATPARSPSRGRRRSSCSPTASRRPFARFRAATRRRSGRWSPRSSGSASPTGSSTSAT